MMVPKPFRPLLVTHSGAFHLDDAFAYAVLRLALGLGAAGVDHALVRTRDEATVAAADIAWDVGAVHDPAAGRFDHHQRGAPLREDGLPYSAAGLVWRHHGTAAVRTLLASSGDGQLAHAVASAIDRGVVRRIDAIDNGVGEPGDALGLASLVEDLNPPWDSPAAGDRAAEDAAFLRAADLADSFLRHRVEAVRARLAAEAVVLAAHARSADPRILELDRKLPWEGPVFAHGLPALYAVYPVPNGNWMVDAMPPEPGSFAQRLPLPEAWAGLRDADLAAACGVLDAVFVHARRFVGAARSREGAMAMARKAIEIGPEPRSAVGPNPRSSRPWALRACCRAAPDTCAGRATPRSRSAAPRCRQPCARPPHPVAPSSAGRTRWRRSRALFRARRGPGAPRRSAPPRAFPAGARPR
jgi:uncharacterized UPF0160 family protein